MRFAGLEIIRCAKQDALRSFREGGPVHYVYLIESLCMQEERYVGNDHRSQTASARTQSREIFSYRKVQPMEANHLCRVH